MKQALLCLLLTFLALAQGGPSNHFISYLRRQTATGQFDPVTRLPSLPFKISLSGSLEASPTVLSAKNNTVVVSWEGISNPKDSDWIGVYMGDGADEDYLDFYYVDRSNTFQQGFGSLTFQLTNVRSALQFRYFQYTRSNAYKLVAMSNYVSFVAEPLHGHVALADSIDQMRVMFLTEELETPMVQYGENPGDYTGTVTGSSATYTADMICGAPANRNFAPYYIFPGYMHDVLLTKLKPSTRYYYRYGTATSGWSEERSFKTAPLPGTPSTRFVAFGDLGVTTPGPRGTVDLVVKEIDDVDFVLHFGDLSYALGRGYMWDLYMNFIEPMASRSPYMVSIGNHEYCYLTGGENDPSGAPGNGWHPSWGNYENDSGGECGVPTYYRFTMPSNGNSLFWYSFNYGNVHILQMSTEHDFTAGSEQYIWMERDLANVNRTVTPFVVLTGHRPMYNSEKYADDYAVCEGMQEAFEDLLIKYKVDVALYGHYHSYERTCPVYQNECDDKNGLVHITVGSAGAWLDNADYYDVPWSEYTLQEFGYCRLISTEKDLTVEFVRNSVDAVVDSVVFPNRW